MDTNGNISNLFTPYDIALALKEIGFNEDCFFHYHENKQLIADEIGEYNTNNWYKSISATGFCSAPLYDQVIDWFIEKHELNINAYPSDEGGWSLNVYSFKEKDCLSWSDGYKTRKEALVRGIMMSCVFVKKVL